MNRNNGKTAIITASYSGLGSELSKLLARDGYELVLMNRDRMRTEKQADQLRRQFPAVAVRTVIADLSDHESIREAARQISENDGQIHRLFHNAGILQDRLIYSPQQNEIHFEVNAVAPYYLTQLLKPQLAAAGDAVVTLVGSSAMRMVRKVNLEEIRKPRTIKKFVPYAQSKLIAAAAFLSLSEQFAKDGIHVRIVDPGMNKTAMSQNEAVPSLFKLFRMFFSTPDIGATKIYQAAQAENFKGRTGIYIERGKVANPPQITQDIRVQTDIVKLLRETVGLSS